MHIEISVPRPSLTLAWLGGVAALAVVFWPRHIASSIPPESAYSTRGPVYSMHTEAALPDDAGGDAMHAAWRIREAEEAVRRERIARMLREKKEEILRYQLQVLGEERRKLRVEVSEELEEQFRENARQLTSLLQDEKRSEEFILASYMQMMEARGIAMTLTERSRLPGTALLDVWPVPPVLGIAAYFDDAPYKAMFDVEHGAIDIRAETNTPVRAAAPGMVKRVSDNGRGYNSLLIQHGPLVTEYGHVRTFHVREGEEVEAGQIIADSGGMPGDFGSGPRTTGPHLHFAVYENGVAVDPMLYLPGTGIVE